MAEDKDHKKDHGKEGHSKRGHGHGHGGGGHAEGEHEGAPEWLISFADNVMLQMGFFVILLALNMGPKAKSEQEGDGNSPGPSEQMLDYAIAVRQGFNNPLNMNSNNPADQPLIRRMLERQAKGDASDSGAQGDNEEVQSQRPADYKLPGGVVHFEEGSAELSPVARQRLRALADEARGRSVVIEVSGHASAAEGFRSADKGMGLSYQRALAAARELEAAGIPWANFRIVSAGDNDRLQSRVYDAAGHGTNQRVEVIITDTALPADPYAGPERP